MSVKILKANTLRKVDEMVFQQIKQNRNNVTRQIVIVPDQYTQAIEKELFSALNIRCSFDIDVVSFSRLASSYKRHGKKELNQQTTVLLLNKIIAEYADKLKCYRTVSKRRGFANQMYAVITALRNNGVQPTTLAAAAQKIEGYSGDKLKDIAIVMQAYVQELSQNYSDISSMLEEFRENIPNIADLKSCDIYMTGFYSLTTNKRAIMDALMGNAHTFTLGLVDIEACDNARILPRDIKAMENVANKYSASVITDIDRELSLSKRHCLSQIFSFNLLQCGHQNTTYNVWRTRSVEEEIRSVAQDISAKIRQRYRYRDFAVVCEDIDKYSGMIAKVFSNYDIAYFIDDKRCVKGMPHYKFVQELVSYAKEGRDRVHAINMLKSGLVDCSYDQAQQFENYLLQYNIDKWQLKSPLTLGDEEERIIYEKYRRLVEQLAAKIDSTVDVADIIEVLKEIFLQLSTVGQEQYILADDKKTAKAIQASWVRIDNALDDAELMLTGVDMGTAMVWDAVLASLESISISVAPVGVDNVFVGTPSESRFEGVKVMYIAGAVGDSYPITSTDNGIIRDQDLDILQRYGVVIEPNSLERNKQSKFYLSQLLVRAEDSVNIVCPSLYGEMSYMATSITKLFGIAPTTVTPNIAKGDDIDAIATKIGAKHNIDVTICRYLQDDSILPHAVAGYLGSRCDRQLIENYQLAMNPVYHADIAKSCFRDNYLKISGIESYYSCPLRYYVDNGIKARPRQEGRVEINQLGSFIHRVLELYYSGEGMPLSKSASQVGSASEQDIHGLVEYVLAEKEFEHFNYQDSSGGYVEQLKKRCYRVIMGLDSMLQRSQYKPAYLEYTFGMKDARQPIELDIDGTIYKVRGAIDRIDEYQDGFIVIDYKSSDKDFGVKNVFCGERLQLIVYLKAILQEMDKQCTGLYYLGLPYKYAKESEEEDVPYSYAGFVVDNQDIIKAQDSECENNSFLPLKYKKKDGQKTIDYTAKNLLQPQHLDILKEQAIKLVKQTVKTISTGYINPCHTEHACSSCEYASICKQEDKSVTQMRPFTVEWEKDNG